MYLDVQRTPGQRVQRLLAMATFGLVAGILGRVGQGITRRTHLFQLRRISRATNLMLGGCPRRWPMVYRLLTSIKVSHLDFFPT